MVNFAVTFAAAALALATGSAAQISIACTGAAGCGSFWISQGSMSLFFFFPPSPFLLLPCPTLLWPLDVVIRILPQ